MATPKPSRTSPRSSRPAKRSSSSSVGVLLAGVLLGLAVALAALFGYLHLRHHTSLPLTAEPSTPDLAPIPPSRTRRSPPADASAPASTDPGPAPFGISEDVFEAGAHLYTARCASCHGTPAHGSATQTNALQLWRPNASAGSTGDSMQPPARIYRLIADGNPASGMPAYRGVLTTTQIWQLSLLLSSAGQDLPDPVQHILNSSRH